MFRPLSAAETFEVGADVELVPVLELELPGAGGIELALEGRGGSE